MPFGANLGDRLRRVASRQHPLVKELRRALASGQPTADGCVAVEGVHLVEEAIRAGARFRALMFAASAEDAARRLLPQIGAQVETLAVPDDIFRSLTATETPQGVAALARLKSHTLSQLLEIPEPLFVVLHALQDPGNLGTVLRSAEAFGASAVLLGENSVSPFNAKAVRASACSLFRLPVVNVTLEEALAALRARGVRCLASSSHKGTPADQARLWGPLALVIGSEAAGLPRRLLAQMDEVVAIPHSPRVESLNAGVAASILLYEAARQRRTA